MKKITFLFTILAVVTAEDTRQPRHHTDVTGRQYRYYNPLLRLLAGSALNRRLHSQNGTNGTNITSGIRKVPSEVNNSTSNVPSETAKVPDGIINCTSSVPTEIGNVSNGIAKVISSIPSELEKIPGEIINGVLNVPSEIGNVTTGIAKGLLKIPMGIVHGISNVTSGIEKIPGKVVNGISEIPSAIANVTSGIAEDISEVPSGIVNGISNIASGIAKVPRKVVNGISEVPSAIANVTNGVAKYVSNIPSDITNSISSLTSNVENVISGKDKVKNETSDNDLNKSQNDRSKNKSMKRGKQNTKGRPGDTNEPQSNNGGTSEDGNGPQNQPDNIIDSHSINGGTTEGGSGPQGGPDNIIGPQSNNGGTAEGGSGPQGGPDDAYGPQNNEGGTSKDGNALQSQPGHMNGPQRINSGITGPSSTSDDTSSLQSLKDDTEKSKNAGGEELSSEDTSKNSNYGLPNQNLDATNNMSDTTKDKNSTSVDASGPEYDTSYKLNMQVQTPSSPEHDTSGDVIKMDKSQLKNFIQTHLSLLQDKLLYIYNDKEKPVKLKLDMPNLNKLNLNRVYNNQTIIFKLYTRQNPLNYDPLEVGSSEMLEASHLNSTKPTVFIIHGWTTSTDGPSVTLIRDAYLKTRDANIITIDWSKLSNNSYTVARLLAPSVGKHIGKMINFLVKNPGINPNTTILIGHSLGAHVMGFAGQSTLQKVNHTIGLDPAGPLFSRVEKDQRLSDDDAKFVEIIHTNAGLLGIYKSIGHYDFYPNGGILQNGCEFEESYNSCAHSRSYKYLAEQISRTGPEYYAVKCKSYKKFLSGKCSKNYVTIMGELELVPAEKGDYYLETKATPPYGEGPNFVNLTG